MKKVLPIFLFLLTATYASAYNPIAAEPKEQYAVLTIEGDPYTQREYLGDLEDYPDMYEVTSDVTFDLKVKVRQRATSKPKSFALILVRQNDGDGGVTEVARLNQPVTEWTKVKEPSLGMTFLESSVLEKQLIPGTYRVEISTPDNKGDYMLVVGDESYPANFFKAIAQIYITQSHFNYTPLHMLFSAYIFYPLGSGLIIYGMYWTWKNRKKIRR